LEFSNNALFDPGIDLTPSHNSSVFKFDTMEADCQDDEDHPSVSPKQEVLPDLQQFLSTITTHISNATTKMSTDFHSVISANNVFKQELLDANMDFKQEVRDEIAELRMLLHQQQQLLNSNPSSTQHLPSQASSSNAISTSPLPVASSTSTQSSNLASSTSTPPSTDQVLLLLTESFSKMANALTEKQSDSKSEWPKFAGDVKKFRSWYLAIMTQLSIAPWKALYNSSKNDVVASTTDTTLNEKLYSKVILALDGTALQHVVSRKHLRANGLAVLQDLVHTYKPKNIPEVIAAKTAEFWGTMKRQPSESVDTYFNRFQELLDDLTDAEEQISTKSALRQFLFTLGPEFEPIQHNYRINNLPDEWKTQDWSKFLVLCRDYYNSVKPSHSDRKTSPDILFDKEAHQKKVRNWFLNPTKYCQMIEAEQRRHPNKCIYHLSKTHQTDACAVKKECDRIISGNPTRNSSSTKPTASNVGQLRHLTEESHVVEDDEETPDNEDDMLVNDTNEDALIYFERLSKHYLRLVKSNPSTLGNDRHNRKFPVIADSGANFHMFKDREFFDHISPASGTVILGDGKTKLNIQGIGTVTCKMGSNLLTIPGVRYVPDLSESIYSLFLHIKTPEHGLDSSFQDGLYLRFPSFQSQAIIGSDDIYLDMLPISSDTNSGDHFIPSSNINSTYCRHLNVVNDLSNSTTTQDNFMQDLRRYYSEVKTKRQLGLNIPAGFRSRSNHQQQFILHTPPRKSSNISTRDPVSLVPSNDHEQVTPLHSNTSSSPELFSELDVVPEPEPSTSPFIPIIRSVDKVSSSMPNTISMTEDYLRSCVGFRRIDTLKKHLKTLYQPTITMDNTPPDAILDPGYLATLRKKDRNTSPVMRPARFGDVIHLDIVFGPDIAVGNVHYGLICVDRFSRMTYMYPLQNLTSDIQKQLESFFAHLGMIPKRIISDFDFKLVGGQARRYLNSLLVHVNAAPAYRQDKNGLAERHWQTLVSMARNWLASAELPATFWFYAVRRAAEVCNYFPLTQDDGSLITPFELAHHTKPDLRNLFKPFTLAAVRRERNGDERLQKFDPQSIPMIVLGRCPTSNGLQFYNPVNGTFISSIDYVLQNHVTSGSRFGLQYQPGTFIYRLDETNSIFAPKFKLDSTVLVHTHSPPHTATVINLPTYNQPNLYTVKFADGTIAEYSADSNILELAPVQGKSNHPTLLPHWIKGGCTATLFLHDMSKPSHGRLYEDSDGKWIFCTGHKFEPSKGTILSDLEANAQQLLDTGQLFRGHTKFPKVYQARQQTHLKDCVLRHVSAHGLHSLIAPPSLKHHTTMSSNDKQIWDAAYNEEYDGLTSIPTWEVLTESQFRLLSKDRKSLPSMAISTIKYDANNHPKRAKYRIVVLGNLDYHNWSKESTAAPVMSQLELRLLTSLAVYHKRVLRNCDIKQAFVQSSLPVDEEYFVRPPVGCPKSSPGTYWRLIRSLYGLKRAPKLWFEKLSLHLKNMGLQNCKTSPCLFYGTLIEGEPPVFVGIYVDDIIYFSPSDKIEREFEHRLSSIGEVDFMGQVTHFLGIEFTWHRHVDGNLSVILTQQSFTENLLDTLNYSSDSTSTFTTPYRPGLSIDSIPTIEMTAQDRDKLRLQYQSLVGSLNWLAHTTRPDISTVVSLLAQHQSNPSPGHLDAAHYVVKYLSHTKQLGIFFSSLRCVQLSSFLHFPVQPSLLSMSDANWGPQDASLTTTSMELPLFTSRSMSAYFIDLFGPLHWMSKRQQVTACSSAEAEIYATNECVKFLLELSQLLDFLEVRQIFMPGTTIIFNDNSACVNWSKRCTTKGLRHIQMRENHVRENVENKFVTIQHIGGKLNLADLFTKEMKDVTHFVELRDLMMKSRSFF